MNSNDGENCSAVLANGELDAAAALAAVAAPPDAAILDRREATRTDLASVRPAVPSALAEHPGCWAYYPWRRTLVGLPGPEAFRALRLDRNRNKITSDEQRRLGELCIGVVGLSVGHAVAHTLAMEGLCGELRLADFDGVEVSNLNRVPASVFDLGVNKAVVAARRIAEIDPFLRTTVVADGITRENLSQFLDGLDVLIEECDSLDLKVLLREEARTRRIPVLMETSDRGLLDVERFDLEPERPIFHGTLGDVGSDELRGLATKDKVPHVLRILGAGELSAALAASMVEVGQTLTTWPQLGGEVALGGATIAAAVRRIGTGRVLASGRVRIDLDDRLDELCRTAEPDERSGNCAAEPEIAPARDGDAELRSARHPAVDAVVEAVRRAPSGGNVQPWRVDVGLDELTLHLDPSRTTTMDVRFRGSYVALGAALFNARVAAASWGVLGPVSLFPDAERPNVVATVGLEEGSDPSLARLATAVARRGTNRSLGRPRPVPIEVQEGLRAAVDREGGHLHLIEPGSTLTEAAEVLAAADRVRYLTETLHREMFSELVFPGASRTDVGIETRMLGLEPSDLAKLAIAQRPEVMAMLAEWDAGTALGDDTRDRIASGSALAVVTVTGTAPSDYVRGGGAVEALWVAAEEYGLAVHPMSPVFLYAVDDEDVTRLSSRFSVELRDARARFRELVGLADSEAVALVLRVSHTEESAPRSSRRPLVEIRPTT